MIGENIDFTDIEPYRDEHVKQVLVGLLKDEPFLEVMEYVYPEKTVEELDALLLTIDTIDKFQSEIAYQAMKNIINGTVQEITIDGLDKIEKDKEHLFISNHRDIILDSALFNVLLHEREYTTTETAIGDNLLGHPTVNALTKLNKNFTVKRDLVGRELYDSSLKLSQYIRRSVMNDSSSIWISQREGRAKDGDDKTQKGVLNMLGLSSEEDLMSSLKPLNIRTLSVSYEYDPCDVVKIREIIARTKEEDYIKKPGEDKQSIILGITGKKGRVNFTIGSGNIFSAEGEEQNKADQLQQIATNIDKEIYSNYKLWPNNYIACDMLSGV
ncbi:MAG: hypothetical protein ACI8YO_002010, partial [Gammaproteobacteria bacterium]